jgi:NAD(P)H-hydrate repair Nnr-like enzyme with NAD(P)H-hydrate dehydratase domain
VEAAAEIGVYLHGECADRLLSQKGYRGLIASDLIEMIPSVISEYEVG